MTTDSPTTSPSASGHVTIVFTSDWGVSTGVGQAGRTHSTIERCGDDPVVRGTVITGVLREQAMLAARALDGAEEGKWTGFALWLFGQNPDGKQGSDPHPRHVIFSDAAPASDSAIPVHDTVSLSIDPTTGTARDQFLRFTERAAPGVLTGTFTLIDEAGAEPCAQPHRAGATPARDCGAHPSMFAEATPSARVPYTTTQWPKNMSSSSK